MRKNGLKTSGAVQEVQAETDPPAIAGSSAVAVSALCFAAFAMGSTEFVVVGLLPEIAGDLHVSLQETGLLVSLYAMTIFLAAPFVSAATSRFSTRKVLFSIMALFSLCNILAGIAPTYPILLISRIITAVCHGAFFGVATTVAMSLVDKDKAGRAVALVMSGVTVAMIVGVPLGSWAGRLFVWRVPFLVIGAMGVASVAMLYFALPKSESAAPSVRIAKQLSQLANLRFLRLYVLTALAVASTLVFFTYLSPYLTGITGVGESTVEVALLVFGLATVFGNLVGGRLTDAVGWRNAMSLELIGLAASLLAVLLVGQSPYFMLGVIGLIGFFGFSVPSIMQSGVVETAKAEAADAVNTASGITVAAMNFGITAGSFIGGLLLAGPGLGLTPVVGAGLAAIAFVLVRLPYAPPGPLEKGK